MSQSIEEMLEQNIVKIRPVGYSMYPVIVPGRDYVYIDKADFDKLKRGDVILYKRPAPDLRYVLHRVYKVNADGVYTVGDNQSAIEGPLKKDSVIGIMTAMERKGRRIGAESFMYRFVTGIWLAMRPVRRPVSQMVHKLRTLKKRQSREMLYKMAYSDELTGLFNRRYCEEVLSAISKSDREYIVYSFDLNDLKMVNDTLGHSCGDCLISGFADILRQTFPEGCVIGRMGGDEYIVIKDAASMTDCDLQGDMKRLDECMARYNDNEKRFRYSVACGCARRSEVNAADGYVDAHDVYVMADNRMYTNKNKMKCKEHD